MFGVSGKDTTAFTLVADNSSCSQYKPDINTLFPYRIAFKDI